MITHTRLILAAGALAALSTLTTFATTRYVWQDSPSPGPPYDTWLNAAHVIQDAVDAALAGIMTNRLVVDKPLTVRSVNGPQFNVIQGYQVPGGWVQQGRGGGAIRCVCLTSGASLSGFTLTNGATLEAGNTWSGGNWRETSGGGGYGGMLINCTLTSDSAAYTVGLLSITGCGGGAG